jgi:hypothetical protein
VSEASGESGEALREWPRTGKFWEVLSTGLPFRPRRSLEGLPGAPAGSLSLYSLGRTMEQFSHVSGSESKVLLGLLLQTLPAEEG